MLELCEPPSDLAPLPAEISSVDEFIAIADHFGARVSFQPPSHEASLDGRWMVFLDIEPERPWMNDRSLGEVRGVGTTCLQACRRTLAALTRYVEMLSDADSRSVADAQLHHWSSFVVEPFDEDRYLFEPASVIACARDQYARQLIYHLFAAYDASYRAPRARILEVLRLISSLGYLIGTTSLVDPDEVLQRNGLHVKRPIPQYLRKLVFARDSHTCCHCGTSGAVAKLQADHVIPEFLGGRATLDNLQTLCASCNAAKGSRIDYRYPLAEASSA